MHWLVVDDTATYRKILSDALKSFPEVKRVSTAPSGQAALRILEQSDVDAVSVDYEMPGMNGLEFIAEVTRRNLPCAIIMVSAHTPLGAKVAIDALDAGALDVIAKPDGGGIAANTALLVDQLGQIIKAVHTKMVLRGRTAPTPPAPGALQRAIRTLSQHGPAARIVAIGASTGGPQALTTVLCTLPPNLGVPVVITVHMPPAFTGQLAASLQRKSGRIVCEAPHGAVLQPDTVYIAPGGKHLGLESSGDRVCVRLSDDPPENNCRPSVDYMFRSVAKVYKGDVVAAILTGMGADGVAGMKMLKLHGAVTIAQDERTSVVFGMPMKAIEAQVVDHVLALDDIGPTIGKLVRKR